MSSSVLNLECGNRVNTQSRNCPFEHSGHLGLLQLRQKLWTGDRGGREETEHCVEVELITVLSIHGLVHHLRITIGLTETAM